MVIFEEALDRLTWRRAVQKTALRYQIRDHHLKSKNRQRRDIAACAQADKECWFLNLVRKVIDEGFLNFVWRTEFLLFATLALQHFSTTPRGNNADLGSSNAVLRIAPSPTRTIAVRTKTTVEVQGAVSDMGESTPSAFALVAGVMGLTIFMTDGDSEREEEESNDSNNGGDNSEDGSESDDDSELDPDAEECSEEDEVVVHLTTLDNDGGGDDDPTPSAATDDLPFDKLALALDLEWLISCFAELTLARALVVVFSSTLRNVKSFVHAWLVQAAKYSVNVGVVDVMPPMVDVGVQVEPLWEQVEGEEWLRLLRNNIDEGEDWPLLRDEEDEELLAQWAGIDILAHLPVFLGAEGEAGLLPP
ncbi:hypothetical protein DXG01_005837 [Tephrocybe rancida]|nr:hypothetical protein DXG01_005837 [Tephrocybe rancida]